MKRGRERDEASASSVRHWTAATAAILSCLPSNAPWHVASSAYIEEPIYSRRMAGKRPRKIREGNPLNPGP